MCVGREHEIFGLKELCLGNFQAFWSKLPQNRTKYLCRTRNAYITLRGRYQVNFRRENKPKSEFYKRVFQDRSDKLEKLSLIFQDAIHFHSGHLQPKTLMFTFRV